MDLFQENNDNEAEAAPAAPALAADGEHIIPNDAPHYVVALMEQNRRIKRKLDQIHREQRKHARLILVCPSVCQAD